MKQVPSWSDLDFETFSACDFEHRVFRIGNGSPVILLHEVAGLSDSCLELGNELSALPSTVYMPLLYGEPGDGSLLSGGLKALFCLRRELVLFGRGQTSPLVKWLRALIDHVAEQTNKERVGMIGMCMTGGLVFGVLSHTKIKAAVASQPSLPFPWLWKGTPRKTKADLGTSKTDLLLAERSKKPLMALRYSNDWMCPKQRLDTLWANLEGTAPQPESGSTTIQICSGSQLTTVEAQGNKHSVLTTNVVPEAKELVFSFLSTHL